MSQIRLSREREPLGVKGNFDFTPKRAVESWTDQRIEEIKQKYESSTKKIINGQLRNRVKTEYFDKENAQKAIKTDYDCYPSKTHQKSINNSSVNSYLKTSDAHFSSSKQQERLRYHTSKTAEVKLKTFDHISAFDTYDNEPFKLPLQREKPSKYTPIRFMTEFSTFTRHRQPSKLNRLQTYDSRMENIDKINSKIKKILDCINNCEKESNIKELDMSNLNKQSEMSQSYLNRSIISNDMRKSNIGDQFQETKILQKRKFQYNHDQILENPKFNQQKPVQRERIYPKEESQTSTYIQNYLNLYKSKLKNHNNNLYRENNVTKEKQLLRSSSCYSKLRRQSHERNNKSTINEEKIQHITREIDRFHHKIEELEEKKRKMNIEFKPYDYDHSPAKKNHRQCTPDSFKKMKKYELNRHQQTRPCFFKNLSKDFVKECQQKTPDLTEKKEFESQEYVSEYSLYNKKLSISHLREQQNKIQKSSVLEDIQESLISQESSQNTSKPYDNEELRKKIGERMQERRKIIEDLQNEKFMQTLRPQTQKLIEALCKQVSLDEELRNAKNWFAESRTFSKVHTLREQLIKNGFTLSLEQIEKEFNSMNDEQNDPFFSFRQQKFTVGLVAQKYSLAQQFWNSSLLKQWDFDQLIETEHFMKKIKNKKEMIIEDFVRLLNTETGNFYRNRDLYLIFDRIRRYFNGAVNEKITIQQLIKVLGK